jgi:translation initiation factor 1
MPNNNPTVYSTEWGKICPKCQRPVKECQCKQKKQVVGDGIVRLLRQSKGRNGKPVSLITGLPLDDQALRALAKELKSKCGTGGTVKDGIIEIQGEHREKLVEELEKRGFKVKIAGG